MRRLLILISAIVLVETIFFSALSPLLPHYTDELGLSKLGAGILVAAYAAGGFVGAIPGGLLATRVGVKPTVLAGLALLASMSVVFGFAETVWLLDAARFGQGVGSALAWTGGLAWLVAAAPSHRRGELIGVAMGAAVGGALLGPVLGGAASLTGPGPAFSAVAAVALVLAGWAWTTPAFPPGARQPLRSLAGALREPRVAAGVWLLVLPSLLFGVLGVLGPLRLDELGLSEVGIGVVFLIGAGVEALLSPLLGRWSDRRGRLAPVRAALLLSFLVSLAVPWPDNRWLLAVLVGVAGVFYAMFFVPGTALLSDGAEASGIGQGFGFALLNLAWAPGHVVGSAAAGGIAELTGDAVPYLILAFVCLLALADLQQGMLGRVPDRHAPADSVSSDAVESTGSLR